MTQPVKSTNWLDRLDVVQRGLLIAYAISLPISMTASWALLIIGAVIFGVHFACSSELRKSVRAGIPLGIPLAVLALAIFVSGIANGGIGEALRSLWSLKAIAIYFIASPYFAIDELASRLSVSALLVVGAIAGIWGTIQQIFDVHPHGFHYLQGTGFLGGPMPFAGQMQLFSMVALGLLWAKGNSKLPAPLSNRIVFAVIALSNLSGLVFAAERSAWLGGMIGVLALAGLMSRRAFISTVAALAIVVGLGWFAVPVVHNRIAAAFNPQQDVSTRVRFQVWQTAINEWQKKPVVGIGFLHFPHLDIPEAIVPGRSKDLNHAHSNYLQFLSTTGVLGLTSYLYLLFASLFYSVRLRRQGTDLSDPFAAGVGAGLFAALISLAVAGIFEYNFGTAQVRLAQWFMLALLALSKRVTNDAANDRVTSSH